VTASRLYPFCFKPVYKDYIWGGDKIIRLYQRGEKPGVYAESWEVSDRTDGMSVVAGGPMAGRTLHELVQSLGAELLGHRVRGGVFPLLIKLIDSRDRLSVQVHPDDDTAKRFGGEAKTEMWYVLDAEPGAGVFAGLKPGVGEKQFNDALRTKRFKDILTFVPVEKGDAIFVPGGRVHAIDAGCLLLEVQQNSNTTYRIYDWDRVGADGRPRPLHLREAMRVIRWDDTAHAKVAPRRLAAEDWGECWEILRSAYFLIERILLSEPASLRADGRSFQVFFVSSGGVTIRWEGGVSELAPGTSCLVPAALGEFAVEPKQASAEVLRITVP
jgi:mannose-6-phosphate isomerase